MMFSQIDAIYKVHINHQSELVVEFANVLQKLIPT